MHNWMSIADVKHVGNQVKFMESRTPEERLYIERQRERNAAARRAAEARKCSSDYHVSMMSSGTFKDMYL